MAAHLNLSKNQHLDLTKEGASHRNVRVTMTWAERLCPLRDPRTHEVLYGADRAPITQPMDADISVFCLQDTDQKRPNGQPFRTLYLGDTSYIVYYGMAQNPGTSLPPLPGGRKRRPCSPGKEIVSSGDNRTGGIQDGIEGEYIDFKLDELPAGVVEVVVVGTIDKAEGYPEKNWNNLGAVMTLTDLDTGEVFAAFNMDAMPELADKPSLMVGSFYRDERGKWDFAPVGMGLPYKTLNDFVAFYTNPALI